MVISTSSALSADNILDLMSKSLPSSDPEKKALSNPYAAIALFTHACMLAVNFRLVGLGEDDRIDAQSEPQDVQPLPPQWDASSTYAFRYKHPQSSMEYLVKTNRLGSKALIFGIGLGDDKTAQFEIKAQDYISENSLKNIPNEGNRLSSLRDAFISPGRISDLISLFKLNIIQKLAPGISKEGYEDNSNTQTQVQEQPRRREETRPPARDPLRDDPPEPARPHPFDDPLAVPRRPRPVPDFAPPGFEDEYEMGGRMGGGGIPAPGARQPFGNIGERDLYPPGLGPHDPLRIGPGGGGGGGGFRGGGGGMHPTFDDPIFGGQGGYGGYDPQAPPGARYDPVGPGDGPPNLRGGPRFPGGRGGGGGGFGGPPNPFGGFGGGDFI